MFKAFIARLQRIDKNIVEKIILGFIIRVILMVSSCHFDLLSYYWYSHFLVYHQRIPASLFNGNLYFLPILYINGLWLFIIKPLINGGVDPWPDSWFLNGNYQIVNIETWKHFVSQPGIQLTLFLLKIPYLIAEIFMIILIIRMLGSYESRKTAFNFLIFNPVSLFVIYAFSSFDILTVLFVILSIYLISRKLIYAGAIAFGFSIILKLYTFFMLPAFFIIEKKNRKRFFILLVSFLPLAFIFFIAGLKGKLIEIIRLLFSMPYADYFVSLAMPYNIPRHTIYPFVIVFCICVFYILYRDHKAGFLNLAKYILILSLVFYTFCYFHPQYFLIIVPLVALQLSIKAKTLNSLFYTQVVSYFVYVFWWGKDIFWRIFMPLAPGFFTNLSSPYDIINYFYSADKFIGIFHSVFAAANLCMCYVLVKQKKDDIVNSPGL